MTPLIFYVAVSSPPRRFFDYDDLRRHIAAALRCFTLSLSVFAIATLAALFSPIIFAITPLIFAAAFDAAAFDVMG